MTTSFTVKSTVSTTVAHTVTVPVAGNNAMPSETSTSLESTVYVTDVVKATVTTCPVGQTCDFLSPSHLAIINIFLASLPPDLPPS
jgi:hypothetical protein